MKYRHMYLPSQTLHTGVCYKVSFIKIGPCLSWTWWHWTLQQCCPQVTADSDFSSYSGHMHSLLFQDLIYFVIIKRHSKCSYFCHLIFSMHRLLQMFATSLDFEASVDLWSDIIAMEYPSPHFVCLLLALFFLNKKKAVNIDMLLGSNYTIGPPLSQRFLLASAKAQPGGGDLSGVPCICWYW